MHARPCKDTVKIAALLMLAGSKIAICTSVTGSTTTTPSTTTLPTPSTCPARSINYITQTLPQQCLTSSWASKSSSQDNTTHASTPNGDIVPASTTTSAPVLAPVSLVVTDSVIAISPSASIVLLSKASDQEAPRTTITPEPSEQVEANADLNEESDPDSPLDNANFLSFEEWKHQNLAKAGQSAENLGSRNGDSGSEPRRRPGIHIALDSLGEDSEIDIDFGGFVNAGGMNDALPVQSALPGSPDTAEQTTPEEKAEDLTSPRRRGKDAGKTCKERSNYASFDCAATALKVNPECTGSTSVLVENKDSYMLNVCSVKNKFLIVELCDAILIDTVVLANFEYFSSMFRTFRVSVSDRYPVKMDKWKELGTYEARNSREVQAFLVENPLIWAKYLRVEFLTQYGNEYYCPVSLLRVHGTTMMEEFNHEVKASRGEDDSEDGEIEEEVVVPTKDVVSAEVLKTTSPVSFGYTEEVETLTTTATIVEADPNSRPKTLMSTDLPIAGSSEGVMPHQSSLSKGLEEMLFCRTNREHRCSLTYQPTEANSAPTSLTTIVGIHEATNEANKSNDVKEPAETASQSSQFPPKNSTAAMSDSTSRPPIQPSAPVGQNITVNSTTAFNHTASSSVKTPSSTQPPAANPTTQESFFKSVHKRLQLLEANSTLSLQYIEEQSRILRDAFSKVEKRQLSKTSTFLETLNTTVLTELRDFRMQYDQIWQSTVLELSSQREQSAHEVSALSARLTFLTDEIVFQKRMAMLQFMMILLCLGLVIFTRYGGASTYLELPPMVQNAINKSSANLSRYTHFETPPASPPSTRPSSRYDRLFRGLKHQRSPSEESDMNAGARSPIIAYSPPTPESQISHGDRNASHSADESGNQSDGSPAPDDDAFRETKSSPATPNGIREEHRKLVEGPLLTANPREINTLSEPPAEL